MVTSERDSPERDTEYNRSSARNGPLLREGHEYAVDEALSLLANPRRRGLLRLLHAHSSETVTLDAALEELSSRETRHPPQENTRERMRLSLYHQHIPPLEESGVVTFDEEAGTLSYNSDPVLTSLLRTVEKVDR